MSGSCNDIKGGGVSDDYYLDDVQDDLDDDYYLDDDDQGNEQEQAEIVAAQGSVAAATVEEATLNSNAPPDTSYPGANDNAKVKEDPDSSECPSRANDTQVQAAVQAVQADDQAAHDDGGVKVGNVALPLKSLAPPPKVNPWLIKKKQSQSPAAQSSAYASANSNHNNGVPKSILKHTHDTDDPHYDNDHQNTKSISFQSIMKEEEDAKAAAAKKNKKVTISDSKEYNIYNIYNNNNSNHDDPLLMSEEEMIRLAIEASLQDQTPLHYQQEQNEQEQNQFQNRGMNEDLDVKPSASTIAKAASATADTLYPITYYTLNDSSSVGAVADTIDDALANDDDGSDIGSLDDDMKLAIRLSLHENTNIGGSGCGCASGNVGKNEEEKEEDYIMDKTLGHHWELDISSRPLPQSIITTTTTTTTTAAAATTTSASTLSPLKSPCIYYNEDDGDLKMPSKLPPTTTKSEQQQQQQQESSLQLNTMMSMNENHVANTASLSSEAATSASVTPPISTYTATSASASVFAHNASTSTNTPNFITKEEEEQIAQAIMKADDEEMAKSIQLAMKIQEEEELNYKLYKKKESELQLYNKRSGGDNSGGSHVRLVTHDEYENIRKSSYNEHDNHNANNNSIGGGKSRELFGKDDYDLHEQYYGDSNDDDDRMDETSGFQINSSTKSSQWSRYDRNTIIGPNKEIRTKHDIALKNQANADKLLSSSTSTSSIGNSNSKKQDRVSVSDVAYNSFHRSLKNSMKRRIVKGVAAHGTGRAENMNAEQTRGGAMDGNVRLLISKAITNGFIQYCNGVVKEGKEAVVYHANGSSANAESDGFDVAVKVFKRIQEFRGRGAYMDGDPRYHGQKFRNVDKREQVELWTEKEYRNLLRANKGGVPVPSPLDSKENVLFMRFLGEDGWPAPQLREIELKKKSKKWTALYIQTMVAIRRLYHCAKLVHADLSEYNILVCPMSQVENAFDNSEGAKETLQIVLIDFAQAVEVRHPKAGELLRRDLTMTKAFYDKQGIITLSLEESEEFVLKECDDVEEEDNEHDKEEYDQQNGKGDGNEDNVHASERDVASAKEEIKQWRHSIAGWDDSKDMDYIESRLAQLSSTSPQT